MKGDNNTMKGYVDRINYNRVVYGLNPVPIIIPEGGTDPEYDECANFTQHPIDKMTLPFTGIAGYNAWDGYTPFNFSHENDVVTMPNYIYDMWEATIRSKNHMNGDDVIITLSDTWGGWTHGMGAAEYKNNLREKYSVEHQYYTSSNKKHAVGYVKNKSFNINTRGNAGTECSSYPFDNVAVESPRNTEWDDVYRPRRLRINNLKTHTEYKIDWYSYNHYIKTDCIETNKKDGNWGITLEYPELTVSHTGSNDLPVVWYVVQQQSCSSGIVQQNNIEESEESLKRLKMLNNNVNMEEELIVYPNPFNNFISIQSPQKDQMVLKSVEGKVISIYEIEKGKSRENTVNLSAGIYILTFVNKNKNL